MSNVRKFKIDTKKIIEGLYGNINHIVLLAILSFFAYLSAFPGRLSAQEAKNKEQDEDIQILIENDEKYDELIKRWDEFLSNQDIINKGFADDIEELQQWRITQESQ